MSKGKDTDCLRSTSNPSFVSDILRFLQVTPQSLSDPILWFRDVFSCYDEVHSYPMSRHLHPSVPLNSVPDLLLDRLTAVFFAACQHRYGGTVHSGGARAG